MKYKYLKKHWKVYKVFLVTYLKSRLVYQIDFILGMLSQTINLMFSILFLTLIFTQIESLQGWTFNEMLLLAGFGGLILNLHHLFFFALYKLGEDYIISGRLDRFKVRPLNVLFQVYASYLADNHISKLIVNILLVIYASNQIGLTLLTLENLAYATVAITSGVMVLGSIFLTLSTTAFWTGRSQAVFWLFFQISNFRKYPYSIFSGAIQLMLVTIIPIAFASFFPVTFFLEREQWRNWQIISLVVGPIFYYLSYRFWKYGLSNYSSTGS